LTSGGVPWGNGRAGRGVRGLGASKLEVRDAGSVWCGAAGRAGCGGVRGRGGRTVTESVRNLTANPLTLAVRGIDCWDWSNTGNPAQITGRMLGPGETAKYRLERSRNSTFRYDLGVFVPVDGGLRQGGQVNVWSENVTGEALKGTGGLCRRELLGEDPLRTKTTESVPTFSDQVTTIYSDGRNLYGVRCKGLKPNRLLR